MDTFDDRQNVLRSFANNWEQINMVVAKKGVELRMFVKWKKWKKTTLLVWSKWSSEEEIVFDVEERGGNCNTNVLEENHSGFSQ